jgi:hypothetical protein
MSKRIVRVWTAMAVAPWLVGLVGCSGAVAPGEPGPAPPATPAELVGETAEALRVRTITGTFETTYWTDDGTRTTVGTPPPATTSVAALVHRHGTYESFPGTVDPNGVMTIPGVPEGRYSLEISDPAGGTTLVELRASNPDLSVVSARRPDLAYDSGQTRVALTLPTLDPFTPGPFYAGDKFELSSTQADVWERPFQRSAKVRPAAGATSFTGTISWSGHGNTSASGLPDASKGDVVYFYNAPHQMLGSGAGALFSLPIDKFARISNLTLIDGATNPLEVDFVAPTQFASYGTNVLFTQFDALASQVNPAATPTLGIRFGLTIFGLPHTTQFPDAPTTQSMPRISFIGTPPGNAAPLPDTDYGSVDYPLFLDEPLWTYFRQTSYSFDVNVAMPGGAAPLLFGGNLYAIEPEDGSLPVDRAIAPVLGPVTAPQLNGSDAFQATSGVGLTPQLSWSAPSVGSATSYNVVLYDTSTMAAVLTANVRNASFDIPPGILSAGATYLAVITANGNAPWDRLDAPLYRYGLPSYSADCVTAGFAP